ncbi:MAG TPA: hypothetical protein VK610_05675, partial [Rhodothermales bacterium]|nr:hypothetical protein [Rhodothermales bacterium]
MKPDTPNPIIVTDPHSGDGPLLVPSEGNGRASQDREDAASEGIASERVKEQLWWAAGVLYARRYLLLALVFLSGVGAIVLAYNLPVWYQSETRVLLPSENAGFGGLLESLAPGASAILGKANEGYTRFLAILTSRTTLEAVVDRFNLVEEYETANAVDPREAAIKELTERASFDVSLEFDYLSISVMDRDPRRAAQIADYFVEVLNRRHITMSSGSAGENRRFLETRLQEAEADMDSAQAELQGFQERYGVVQLESQADALVSAMALAQGQVAEAEVQYQALRSQYGDDNPEVATARAGLEAARAQASQLTNGGSSFMPVPMQRLPAVGRRYAQIMAELKTQEEIIRVVRPLYEQSVLTERRDVDAVQVLDPASIPSRKAAPQR